jgi:hypothetical protein
MDCFLTSILVYFDWFIMKMQNLISDIVDLEEENSIDQSRFFSEEYNKKDAISLLIQEHNDSSGIVCNYQGEVLCSFIRFIIVNNTLTIRSLQIKRKYEYSLRNLIHYTYNRIVPLEFDFVQGEAYKTNSLAIRFHTKLGFVYTQDLGDKLEFLVDRPVFLSAIKKYIK